MGKRLMRMWDIHTEIRAAGFDRAGLVSLKLVEKLPMVLPLSLSSL